MIVVRFAISASSADRTTCSLIVSRCEVASSKHQDRRVLEEGALRRARTSQVRAELPGRMPGAKASAGDGLRITAVAS